MLTFTIWETGETFYQPPLKLKLRAKEWHVNSQNSFAKSWELLVKYLHNFFLQISNSEGQHNARG